MASQHRSRADRLQRPERWGWSRRATVACSRALGARSPGRATAMPMMAIVGVIAFAALALQLGTYPNHDVAWVLWGTRELLRGATWGIDLIEPNPPLAWYLSMPTTAAAMWLDVPLDRTFRIAVALAAAASAIGFASLLRSGTGVSRNVMMGATAAVGLLLLPGREFGQREHLLAIVILPYVALVWRRLADGHSVSRRAAIMIGIVAGLGFGLKPYFLAVPLFVELAVQILSRRRTPLLRAENVAIGAVIGLYALSLPLLGKAYLDQVVPLAQEIYWSFDLPFAQLLPAILPSLSFAVVAMAYACHTRDKLGILLGAAFAGVALSYFVQHKGYGYHLFPVTIVALVMAAHFATSLQARYRAVALAAMILLVIASARPVVAWWNANRPDGARTTEIDRLRHSIAAHAGDGGFLVVAVHPHPAFPVALYTPAHYVSRTNSQWFLPAVVRIRTGGAPVARAAVIEQHARDFILHDLAARPDLVMIDRDSARHTANAGSFDFLSFYQEDPAFRQAWSSYREIEPLGSYRQFVRMPRTSSSMGRPS